MTKKIQTAIYLDPDLHKDLLESGFSISGICNIILRRIINVHKQTLNQSINQEIKFEEIPK